MIRSLRAGLLGGALLLTLAGALVPMAAQAHSPYLLPTVFDASDRKVVTVQGAFTESFFTPEVVMKSDAYAVIGPDGVRSALTPTYSRRPPSWRRRSKSRGPTASPRACAAAARPRRLSSRDSGRSSRATRRRPTPSTCRA